MRKLRGNRVGASSLDHLVQRLAQVQAESGFINPTATKALLSTESISQNDELALDNAQSEFQLSIENVLSDLKSYGFGDVTEAQFDAAVTAGILAGDYRSTIGRSLTGQTVSTENVTVVPSRLSADTRDSRFLSVEAFDERENKNAMIYSVTYNMRSARQDEFGETIFPTIVLPADQVGLGVQVTLMNVFNGVQRQVSGTFEDWNMKNIIRAVANPDILRKQQTLCVPVYRAGQSDDKFATGIAAATINHEGELISTAPLAVGKRIDLLGISQTDTMLAAGINDQTDSLDPGVELKNVYVKVGNDILKVNVKSRQGNNFTYNPQDNYRSMILSFEMTDALLNKATVQHDGSALGDLEDVVTEDLIVRFGFELSGKLDIEGKAPIVVHGLAVNLQRILDSDGEAIDLSTGVGAALVALFNAAEVVGYDVVAYRTNANVRQNGQFINVTRHTQLYNIPLRDPITALHPVNTDGQTDNSDIQSLIQTTRTRIGNEAVTTLIETAEMLSNHLDQRESNDLAPDLLGAGRFYVRPSFFAETLDVNSVINSITSHERAADIQAVLVNKCRDLVYQMYRDSEWKAAADALAGGIAPPPTVWIATDPVIARYINVTGDLRTLGGEFDVRVVQSLDYRMAGKIFMGFTIFDENRNVAPNVMNFANLVWAPELVLTANISRNGRFTKETVVQPRYDFIVHCPVMAVLEVENIPDTLNRVPLEVTRLNP